MYLVSPGGPKLRKWYGAEEKLPSDGGEPGGEPEEEEDPNTDYVLVTDADSPSGELIVTQLILARRRVKVCVYSQVSNLYKYVHVFAWKDAMLPPAHYSIIRSYTISCPS